MLISIVIPLYNERENIRPLVNSLRKEMAVLKRKRHKAEVIMVDDGSDDGTFSEIKKARGKDKRFKAIRFRRNFGQTAAFSAGFAIAKGDVVITMDGDL
ncbi:MAG: glycosyltransferase, partial [Candidatus Micrarchaeota archaeon]